MKRNLLEKTFKPIEGKHKETFISHPLLRFFEEQVSKILFGGEYRPCFRYQCEPGSGLSKAAASFYSILETQKESFGKIELPENCVVLVEMKERLKLTFKFEGFLPKEAEIKLAKTRKEIEGMGLLYSRHKRQISLVQNMDAPKRVGVQVENLNIKSIGALDV